jgi:hypothetical protein
MNQNFAIWLDGRIEDIIKFFFVIATIGVLIIGESLWDFSSKTYPLFLISFVCGCFLLSLILHFKIDYLIKPMIRKSIKKNKDN